MQALGPAKIGNTQKNWCDVAGNCPPCWGYGKEYMLAKKSAKNAKEIGLELT